MNNNQIVSARSDSTRREFLKRTALTAGAVAASGFLRTPVYGQATAPSANVLGANSKITLGFVGCGAQGMNAHIRGILEDMKTNNVVPVAVCDLSKTRRAEAKKAIAAAGVTVDDYEQYEQLLARKDVDAVLCATVDHWHKRVSCDSLNAGKHIYVEKPMTRYLDEAFEVYDTVKKTGKVFQVGSQGTSDAKWHKASAWITEGKIGPVVMMQGSYMRNSPKGEWNYPIYDWAKPEDINWAVWHGEQIKSRKEFSADDFFRWRKYYPFCSGLLGDLLPHKLHPYLLASACTEFPSRVACIGNNQFDSDKGTAGTPPRDSAEIVQVIAEFPNGMTLNMTSSSVNETGTQEMIRGTKADLYMGGNKVELKPQKPFADEIDPEVSDPFPPESIPLHHKNWFEAIRGVVPRPNGNIDLAIRVQTIISLAEQSNRMNMMCRFDAKTRKITTGDGKEIPPLTYGSTPQS
jgi:predicted dehydrogenase